MLIKVNFFIQIIVLSLLAICGAVALILQSYEPLIYVLWLQLAVGVYQYIGSLVLKFLSGTQSRLLNWHLSLSSMYIIILLSSGYVSDFYPKELIAIFMFVLPWALAILFGVLSFELFKRREILKKKSFLNAV